MPGFPYSYSSAPVQMGQPIPRVISIPADAAATYMVVSSSKQNQARMSTSTYDSTTALVTKPYNPSIYSDTTLTNQDAASTSPESTSSSKGMWSKTKKALAPLPKAEREALRAARKEQLKKDMADYGMFTKTGMYSGLR